VKESIPKPNTTNKKRINLNYVEPASPHNMDLIVVPVPYTNVKKLACIIPVIVEVNWARRGHELGVTMDCNWNVVPVLQLMVTRNVCFMLHISPET
jgi:hypothetical protein